MKIEEDIKLDFDDVLIKPQSSEISSRSEVNLIVSYICRHAGRQIRGCPVIVSNLDTTGTISMAKALYAEKMFVCLHKYIPDNDLIQFFNTEQSQYSFYTLGISDEDIEKFKRIKQKSNIQMACLDVANGYLYAFLDKIKYIRTLFPDLIIMAGNVCTPEGVENIIKAGASIAKCGLSNGNFCLTKYKTGIGYKQLSVAIECGQAANALNALCCSDGGCKTPADICKALGGGSHFVMCGKMFAGYDQCDGEWVEKDGLRYLKAYGMSSKIANDKYNGGLRNYRTSEGKEELIEYNGDVQDLVLDIKGSLASCCTYTNTKNLENLKKNCVFIR
jgi:GMP reductase